MILKKNIHLDTKYIKADIKKDNGSVTMPERRDSTQYLYYIEKVEDGVWNINKLKHRLEMKQFEVFTTNFMFINNFC